MSSHIAKIDVYPDYDGDGSINLDLPFSYGCSDPDLMGYTDVEELIQDIRKELKNREEEN